MPTNRTVIQRQRHAISDEVIDLFRRGYELQERGKDYTEEYREIALELSRLLGLKPWEPSPLYDLGDEPGSMDLSNWQTCHDRRQELMRAAGLLDDEAELRIQCYTRRGSN